MSNPIIALGCPVCDRRYMYYQKRQGTYKCQRCGSEFSITKLGKTVKYDVVFSPLTTVKTFEKSIVTGKTKPKGV